MATNILHPAPGLPYINLSNGMQAFYARRGMWANGAPRGMLATWLGDRADETRFYVSYWTTKEGLEAMAADACNAPPQAWPNYHQKAQFLRRLSEAGERAGTRSLHLKRRVGTAPATPAAFTELRVPPEGTRPRQAFEQHVMKTLREFVEYTQGSEYTG